MSEKNARVVLFGFQVGQSVDEATAKKIQLWMLSASEDLVNVVEDVVMRRMETEVDENPDEAIVVRRQNTSDALAIVKVDLLTDTERSIVDRLRGAAKKILANREKMLACSGSQEDS